MRRANLIVQQPVVDQDLLAWQKDNEWYGKDRRRTALALGIAQEMREGGNKDQGRKFYDAVADEVDRVLNPPKDPPAGDKVGGGRHGGDDDGGAGNRGGAKQGYASLPADAKAACDADLKKFVGPDKKYKDAAAYRANWASIYHS